jgi:iron complex transport system substrate-binding protein
MPQFRTFRTARHCAALARVLVCFASIALVRIAEAAPLPSVASINLCADQLVLTLADVDQVLTVSWLAADPEESLLAAEAAAVPLNYGSAEELLAFEPDVVVAGAYTNAFTRALLASLDYRVIELQPETSIADIETNLRVVAQAIGQSSRAEKLIARMRAQVDRLRAERRADPPAAVVVRPGGFTVGRGTLADELISLAGLRNVAAEGGLDRWGSLSMETLVRATPDLTILTGYRAREPSLANAVLEHPALLAVRGRTRAITVPAAFWSCGLPQSIESAVLLHEAAHRR